MRLAKDNLPTRNVQAVRINDKVNLRNIVFREISLFWILNYVVFYRERMRKLTTVNGNMQIGNLLIGEVLGQEGPFL